MSRSLIGVVSYGNLPFLELCLRAVQETTTKEYELKVVVAKPQDGEMIDFLNQRGIRFVAHMQNHGFPASVNDLYEWAFLGKMGCGGDFDNLIILGNDVVVQPGCIDKMIETAETTDFDMVCASEYDSRFLVANYEEARQYFHGPNLTFTDFTARPWEIHKERREGLQPYARKDIRNCTLFKRSAFEKAGYDPVSYWPNGYFADNSYARRCDLLNVSAVGVEGAVFFHFWSRTINQGENREHNVYFSRNQDHYISEWGGLPGHEKFTQPYNGRGWRLKPGLFLPDGLKIDTRTHEAETIKYWQKL